MKKIERIIGSNYDSRRDRYGRITHSYTMWTGGATYKVLLDERENAEEICFGWRDYDKVYLVENPRMDAEELACHIEWREYKLNELHILCQEYLAQYMGAENFPWEESFWGSLENYREWSEPVTFEGKLKKARRDVTYLNRSLKNDPDWVVEKSIQTGCYEELILVHGQWMEIRHWRDNWVDTGIKIEHLYSTEEGEKKFNELLEIERRIEESKAKERKEYARKCGMLSRKYRIPFLLVLRTLKGDEELIKKFVESLKKAIDEKVYFDSYELYCGRERRRAEIARLEIEIGNVDPNHITPYIIDCLEKKRIVSETLDYLK